MQDTVISIHQAYKGLAPKNWFHMESFTIQRLYYIKSGTGYVLKDEQKFELLHGYFYLFPCNLNLKFFSDNDDPIDHIYFDFYSTPPIIFSEPLEYEAVGRAEALAKLLDSYIYERPHNIDFSDTNNEEVKLLHELLRLSLMTLSAVKNIPFMTDRIVSDTLEFIRQNYSSQISVKLLAQRLGFEQNYFIRRFRELTGTTPYSFLRSYRLSRAKELIASGKTISETTLLVGYENASSLSRALKLIKKL